MNVTDTVTGVGPAGLVRVKVIEAELGALPAAVTWKMKFPELLRVDGPELAKAATPLGKPDGAVMLMGPTNPGWKVTPIVAVPVKPLGTLTGDATAVNVATGATTLTLMFSVWVIEPNVAVTVTLCGPVSPNGASTVRRDVPLAENDVGAKTAVTPVPEAVRLTGPVNPVPKVTVTTLVRVPPEVKSGNEAGPAKVKEGVTVKLTDTPAVKVSPGLVPLKLSVPEVALPARVNTKLAWV